VFRRYTTTSSRSELIFVRRRLTNGAETYSAAFRPPNKAAGAPGIPMRDTRHTAATMLLDSGITVAAAAEWLGGAAATTLRMYGHD